MNQPIKTPQKIAYFIFRVTLGVTFAAFGASKIFIQGTGNFAEYMMNQFSGLLPEFLLIPFVYTLPYAELLLGLMLIAGLFSVFTLTATGLLVVALTFGAVIGVDPATTANNLIYAIIIFFLLWNMDANFWSIDNKIGRTYE
ncbi:MauE/DoxX family redox-associated membrane protein [Rhodohalobacter halophilus]|uniref:MauE/DoxX family redox-associated membrane protein n=1 Tax=Rhodohalobacter halophilus TaxID=1812810 RepID=UPI00083FCAE8|nr:MauE/DoxX family redox-associated membrane protein [Rhodohalobacter halophilus]